MDQPTSSASLFVRFFGGAAIEEAGRPVSSRAGHRHPLALLALLSTAPGHAMSRDKLLAFLWPDADPASLRHRLSVTVYEIRRALGKDAIRSVHDDLRLDPAEVRIDLVEFEAAVAGEDHARAVELCRGPFLDGFHLPDSDEFSQWAASERERLGRAHRRSLEALAGSAERAGDHRRAVRLRRRIVDQDPYGSGAVVGLMRALVAAGEPGEALRAAERHARDLEEELGVAPDPGVASLAAGIRDESRARPWEPEPGSGIGVETGPDPEAEPDGVVQLRVPPRPRWVAALAAVLGAVLLLALPWIPTPGGSADEVVPDRVVVLPFAVRGSPDFSYLGEGMAEILGTTLDGVGTLRTADPHAVLAFVEEHGLDLADPASGRRVAERFGAGRFVLGSIVESGDRLRVQATIYRADGTIESRGSAGAGADREFFEMVDGLTRQLLVPRFDPDEERLTRLAVVSSASLEALKSYLEGETHLRAGDFPAASEAFQRAIRADSTFALAWYRLAVSAEWGFQPHDAAVAVRRAVELAGRLPERDRLLLVGWDAYARGEADRAESIYRRILDARPDEVEAWLQLGEIRFHYAPSRGRTIADSREAFERVLALDPAHEGARIHLARVAALERDLRALERHAAELSRRIPGSQGVFEARSLLAFAARDSAAARSLAAELRSEDSYVALGVLLGQFHVGDVEGIEWAAGLLAAPERPVEVRTAGHVVLALVREATGRRAAAESSVAAAEALDLVRGGELRALVATLPFAPPDPAALTAARAALDRGESGVEGESFFLPDHDRVRPLLRAYLRGLVHAGMGERGEALQRAEEIQRMASPAADPTLARDLALGLRAEVEWRAGRTSAALAYLEQIEAPPHYELVLPSPFHPRARERFLHARLLEEVGRSEEALRIYAASGNRSLFDLPYRAPVRRRMGDLLAGLGDAAGSAESYREFVALWQGADAELRPQVTAIRSRLATLSAESAGRSRPPPVAGRSPSGD